MIELSGVSKVYNSGKPSQYTAVDNLDLRIPAGRVTVLKGPSGSGKTTLLSLVGCMSRPSSGRILLRGIQPSFFSGDPAEGLVVSSLPERFLTEIRRKAFGFIFQQFNLVKGITVLENVMLPAYPLGETQALLKERARGLLELFSLGRQATGPVEWLSGGELQRVAIARALINDPAVIIADEPTAHLDSRLSRDFMDIVAMLQARGVTVLIASHDPIVYESSLAGLVVEMRDGRIGAGGPAA